MVGSPPREFHLLFDTGSDVTWVPCISCTGCPRTTGGVSFCLLFFLLHAVISTMLHIYWYVSFMFHSLRSASMIMAAHRLQRWSVVNINCALIISRTQIKMRFLDTMYRIKSILTWLPGSLPLLSPLSLGKALIFLFFFLLTTICFSLLIFPWMIFLETGVLLMSLAWSHGAHTKA